MIMILNQVFPEEPHRNLTLHCHIEVFKGKRSNLMHKLIVISNILQLSFKVLVDLVYRKVIQNKHCRSVPHHLQAEHTNLGKFFF